MKVKGMAYYPEHWDEKNWLIDLGRMKDMGVNTVRIGEFMWSTLEPDEGVFDFSLLDKMIACIESEGLNILLGTPTATFPAWILSNYDYVLAVDQQGRQRKYGTRRQYCYNSKAYKALAVRITKKVVERYQNRSSIIGIQLDNELGHEGSDFCTCENCKKAFRVFLKDKYQSIEELNDIYGNIFWGQQFMSFEDIDVPFNDLLGHNPTLRLDYVRFLSKSLTDFAQALIKTAYDYKGAHQTVTTNLPGGLFDKYFDSGALVENIDFVSFDNYPIWGGEVYNADDAKVAMELDLIRGLKEKKFWIVEELIGAQGHDYVGWLPRLNQAKLWAMQAHLRGAENIFFFRYKGMHKGEEQFCQGVFDVDDRMNDKFDEVKAFFHDVSYDFNTESKYMKNKTAMIYDFDNIWSWKIQPQSAMFDFKTEFMKHYRALYHLQIGVDVISTDKDFDAYETIILPNMQIITHTLFEKLEAFAKKGKTIVFGYRSGIRDANNNMRLGANILSEMIGGHIEAYEALNQEGLLKVSYENKLYSLYVWRDIIHRTTASDIVKYQDYGFENKSCVIKNEYNGAQVYYMGASFEEDLFLELYKRIVRKNESSNLEQIILYSKDTTVYKLNHSFEVKDGIKPVSYVKQTE